MLAQDDLLEIVRHTVSCGEDMTGGDEDPGTAPDITIIQSWQWPGLSTYQTGSEYLRSAIQGQSPGAVSSPPVM